MKKGSRVLEKGYFGDLRKEQEEMILTLYISEWKK